MFRLTIISLLLILVSAGKVPTIKQAHYKVFKGGQVIGKMIASRSEENGAIEFVTESNVNIKALINISIENSIRSSFRNGILQDGAMHRKVNGKLKNASRITRQANGYNVTDVDGNIRKLAADITLSTACLMHTEPVDVKQIYSENFRKFVGLELVAPHKYALKLPDGDNYYSYKNGICTEMEVPTTFATIFIKSGD